MNNDNYYRVEEIIKYIGANFKTQPDLDELARKFNLSPFYLQKIFTEWVGISPKKFLQYLTVNYLKQTIYQSKNIDQMSFDAGLSSQSRAYDLFINFEGVTPNEYKTFGQNINIEYGIHNTLFGYCFIAITEKGICQLSFIDNNDYQGEIENLKNSWFKSNVKENQEKTGKVIEKVFRNNEKIKLFLKGTQFQLKVWEALLKVPEGKLTTYEGIAQIIGNPKASRAVGNAVGNNNIAYLIPCHRVIRKQALIGDYRWGTPRKQLLIGFEMAKINKEMKDLNNESFG